MENLAGREPAEPPSACMPGRCRQARRRRDWSRWPDDDAGPGREDFAEFAEEVGADLPPRTREPGAEGGQVQSRHSGPARTGQEAVVPTPFGKRSLDRTGWVLRPCTHRACPKRTRRLPGPARPQAGHQPIWRTRPGMTAPPGACAREGVPWPVRRSPHGERRNMAPAGRYSMKAVVRARGTLTHRQGTVTQGGPALFQPRNPPVGARRSGQRQRGLRLGRRADRLDGRRPGRRAAS
jgi:hypothetical protein